MKILLWFKKNSRYIGLGIILLLIIMNVIIIFIRESMIKDVSLIGIASALIVYVLNLYSSSKNSRENKENSLNEKIYLDKCEKLESLPMLVANLSKSALEIKTMLICIDVNVNPNKIDDLDINQIIQYLLSNFYKIDNFLYDFQKLDNLVQESDLNENKNYYNLVSEIYQNYKNINDNTLRIIKNNKINKLGDYNLINDNICITHNLIHKIQYELRTETISIVKKKSKKMIEDREYQILHP